jgi:hypothetical protein
MSSKPPVAYYVEVERLYNRRITLRRDEPDGEYYLRLETCFSKDVAARWIEAPPLDGKRVELLRSRILVTQLVLSREAMQGIYKLYQQHEHEATKRQEMRHRRQQIIAVRLDALANAAIDADLRAQTQTAVSPTRPTPPTAPAPKRGRKPGKPKE